MSESLSRREWLKRAAVAGAAAAVPVGGLGAQRPEQIPAGTPFETLSAVEGETLEAITARLIPSDERGPGAAEARAARYIDRALGGPLAASLPAYRDGLAALDRFAETAAAGRFSDIPADARDAVLRAVEHGSAAGFAGSAAFFAMVRSHTIQGTFSDPAYGGNEGFVGWELIGYPGVRTAVTPELQRMDVAPRARHVSAYDYPAFAAARARRTRGR